MTTATCRSTVSSARAENDNRCEYEKQNNWLSHLIGFDFTNIELNFEAFSIQGNVFFL